MISPTFILVLMRNGQYGPQILSPAPFSTLCIRNIMQGLGIIKGWTENVSSFTVSLVLLAIVRFFLPLSFPGFIHGKIVDFLPGYLFQALR